MNLARETVFSPCRRWRYTLWRDWMDDVLELEERAGNNSAKYAMFIGLNPSTADETRDDPTVRRCVGFAKSWGYGALCMTNIFAWRDTDPAGMKASDDPVGTDNDAWLIRCAAGAGVVVAAWGNHGMFRGRDAAVAKLLTGVGPGLSCLAVTQAGQPQHPLYMRSDLKPKLLSC